jgi:hypothetical protein
MASPAFFASFKIKFPALSLIHARLYKSNRLKGPPIVLPNF